jgi:hypothetical protein
MSSNDGVFLTDFEVVDGKCTDTTDITLWLLYSIAHIANLVVFGRLLVSNLLIESIIYINDLLAKYNIFNFFIILFNL